jgi:hypothetical protein
LRTIVVADVHGRPELLTNALAHSKFEKGTDTLVIAGDFCDIGTQTEECLAIAEKNMAYILVGNHEMAHVLQQSIRPYDHLLDIEPGLISRWSYNIHSGVWPMAMCIDGVLITHAGVSQALDYKMGWSAKATDPVEIARDLNHRLIQSTIHTGDGHLELIGDRWLVFDDLLSPVWFRPFHDIFGSMMPPDGTGMLLTSPAPYIQIAGHTPRNAYTQQGHELLNSKGFYLVDPYNGGRMDIPGYCCYAVIDGFQRVKVVEYKGEEAMH